MNRENRRNLKKQGVSEGTIERLSKLDNPCTIGDVFQISKAMAEDVAMNFLDDYRKRSSGIIMSLSLQVEMLKSIMLKHNFITEEEWVDLYEKSAAQLEAQQKEYIEKLKKEMEESKDEESSSDEISEETPAPKSDVSYATNDANPVEIKILK